MKKHIHTMITAFRDGFQSVYGARVKTKDFLPAIEAAVAAGMTHLEIGGGARFQSLYFYCNEDAFEMHDAIRSVTGPEANLQTLARGINVVGLDSQSRDVIDMHARLFKKHSITTIRNFDALNDVENLVYSGQCIHNAGLKHEVAVSLMGLPPGLEGAHTPEFYLDTLKKILDRGIPFDSVVFKDASGTANPKTVYDTIKGARKLLGEDAHLVFHTHETAGLSISCYLAAIEAGTSQVDCSLAPVSGGTCQPDVMVLLHALRNTEYDLGLDIKKVLEAEEVFKECMADYFLPPEALSVEPFIQFSPMPGGALTANTQMMRDNDILDRYEEIVAAMGEVIAVGGFGTSVTPVSQFYFQQAFNNVMYSKWEKIAEGYGKMVLGYFGKTPVSPDPKIVKIASEKMNLPPTEESPLEINERDPKKGVEAAKKMLQEAGVPMTEENIFIAATCKEKGILYLQGKATENIRKVEKPKKTEEKAAEDKTAYTVTINSRDYSVVIEGNSATVDGVPYSYTIRDGEVPQGAAATSAAAPVAGSAPAAVPAAQPQAEVKAEVQKAAPVSAKKSVNMEAPLAGIILRIPAKEGDSVQKGSTILVLESMKMENELPSPINGRIVRWMVKEGEQVKAGQVLGTLEG